MYETSGKKHHHYTRVERVLNQLNRTHLSWIDPTGSMTCRAVKGNEHHSILRVFSLNPLGGIPTMDEAIFFVVIGWSPCHGVWFSVYHAAWMNSTGCRYILPGDGNALELRTTQPTSLGIRIWRSIWCAMARFSDQDQMDLVLKQWHHVNGTLNSLYSRLQVLRAIQHTLPSEFTGTNAWYKSEKNRRDKKKSQNISPAARWML